MYIQNIVLPLNKSNIKTMTIADQLEGFKFKYLAETVVQPNLHVGVNYNTFIKWINGTNPCPHWCRLELERITKRKIIINE